jgi:hypothetical protein
LLHGFAKLGLRFIRFHPLTKEYEMQNEIPSQKTEHPNSDSSEISANNPKRSGSQPSPGESQRGGSSDPQRNGSTRSGDVRNGDKSKDERSQPGRQGK